MNLQIHVLFLVILLTGCGNKEDERLRYLKQKPPSNSPEIFAPNIVSKEAEHEFGSVFNRKASEFFYGVDMNGKSEIWYSKLIGNSWSEPQTILVHEQYGYNDPFLSPDENRLYFISNRAMDGLGILKDYDIWYVERLKNGWADPINAGSNINSNGDEYYISFTKDGTMYFSSNIKAPENRKRYDFDIYDSKFVDGKFPKSSVLSDSINTSRYEADVFVDPNESYIIFCANRPDGLGQGDLYHSLHILCMEIIDQHDIILWTTLSDYHWHLPC